MRCTCVSTQMFCRLLNARISTRFAVFRPTPGSVSSSSIVDGHAAAEALEEDPARRLHVARLVAIEADGIDQPLDAPTVSLAIVRGVRATLNSRVEAARVVASCVRADSSVAIST